jgi:hypothetical protein
MTFVLEVFRTRLRVENLLDTKKALL